LWCRKEKRRKGSKTKLSADEGKKDGAKATPSRDVVQGTKHGEKGTRGIDGPKLGGCPNEGKKS